MAVTSSFPAPRTTFKTLNEPSVLLFSLFVILDLFYTVGFNLMSDGLRLNFAAAIFTGQAVVGVASMMFRLHPWRLKAFLVLLVLLLCWMASGAFLGTPSTGANIVRTMAPFLVGLWVLGYYDKLPLRLILFMAGFTIVFALAWGLTQPSYYHHNEPLARFAPFHGGPFGKTESSLVILCCVVIVHQIMLAGRVRPSIAWPLIGIGAADLIGFWVTGTQLTALAYFGTHYLYSPRLKKSFKVSMCVLFALAVAWTVINKEEKTLEYSGGGSFDVEHMGSGRVGTWLGRLDLIANRDLPTLLIGSGLGSDDFTSPTWRNKTTSSHQVFLTFVIEGGLIGTTAFIVFIVMMVRLLGPLGYCVFVVLVVGSLLGNGLPLKPMPFVLFWFAAGVVAVRLTESVPTTRPARPEGLTGISTRSLKA